MFGASPRRCPQWPGCVALAYPAHIAQCDLNQSNAQTDSASGSFSIRRSVQSRLSKVPSLTIKKVKNEETSQNCDRHFAFGICWSNGRSDHFRSKGNTKNGVRPDHPRKDRATTNHESRRRADDFGADVNGVRRVSRLDRWSLLGWLDHVLSGVRGGLWFPMSHYDSPFFIFAARMAHQFPFWGGADVGQTWCNGPDPFLTSAGGRTD